MRCFLSAYLLAGIALAAKSNQNGPSWIHSPNFLQRRDDSSFDGIAAVVRSSDKQSYYTVIQAGEVNFRVALDTGSADLWIASSECTSSQCSAMPKYPLAYQSSTFGAINNNQTAFEISYADTTVASGFIAKESIEVANVTSTNQAFALISSTNVTMNDQVSGVLGLGFPRLSIISASAVNATPFVASLAQAGKLDYPVFGLSLQEDDSGTIAIGAIDASVVQNVTNITWTKVVDFSPFSNESNTSSYLQWAIPLDDFSVNGTFVGLRATYPQANGNKTVALIDVGTSGIFGPYQDVSRIFDTIPDSRIVSENGQWVVPCDTTVPMALAFGGKNFTLLPTDYIIGPASGNPNLCLSWPLAIQPRGDGIDWQLGDAFLRTVYSVFSYGINDKEAPMIGLYSLRSAQANQTAAEIASYLSVQSATIATILPNSLLPTPTFTTPVYVFNTTVPASQGAIVKSALATSTYSAIFGGSSTNVSALPLITPPSDLATLVVTVSGAVETVISTVSTEATVTLGEPPGWNQGSSLRAPVLLSSGLLLTVVTIVLNNVIF